MFAFLLGQKVITKNPLSMAKKKFFTKLSLFVVAALGRLREKRHHVGVSWPGGGEKCFWSRELIFIYKVVILLI